MERGQTAAPAPPSDLQRPPLGVGGVGDPLSPVGLVGNDVDLTDIGRHLLDADNRSRHGAKRRLRSGIELVPLPDVQVEKVLAISHDDTLLVWK